MVKVRQQYQRTEVGLSQLENHLYINMYRDYCLLLARIGKSMKGSENCFLFHQNRTSSSLFMNISYIQYVVGFVGNDSLLQFMTLIGKY